MEAKWKKFTRDQLEEFVKDSRSYRELATKIGYSINGGGGIQTVKNMVEELNLDVSHFSGQAWNKDNFDYSRFRKNNAIRSSSAIDALANLRGRKCENCGFESWLNEPIPLEVHHKDGDKLNNCLENLVLLCPNCHALTENWRGKNMNNKTKKPVSEKDFVNALENNVSIRQALIQLGLTPKGGNYTRAYDLIIKYNIEKFINSE